MAEATLSAAAVTDLLAPRGGRESSHAVPSAAICVPCLVGSVVVAAPRLPAACSGSLRGGARVLRTSPCAPSAGSPRRPTSRRLAGPHVGPVGRRHRDRERRGICTWSCGPEGTNGEAQLRCAPWPVSTCRSRAAGHPASSRLLDPPTQLQPESRYLNRELSWLDFNARGALARGGPRASRCWSGRSSSPSSARTSTSSSRSACRGCSEQLDAGIRATSPDGLDAAEQLRAIRARVERAGGPAGRHLRRRGRARARRRRRPLLRLGRAVGRGPASTSTGVFDERVFPVLTPAGGRPRAPVPVHLEPVAEPRGGGPRPGDRRASASPASRCRPSCLASSCSPTASGSCRSSR